jgi:hypothetical protein
VAGTSAKSRSIMMRAVPTVLACVVLVGATACNTTATVAETPGTVLTSDDSSSATSESPTVSTLQTGRPEVAAPTTPALSGEDATDLSEEDDTDLPDEDDTDLGQTASSTGQATQGRESGLEKKEPVAAEGPSTLAPERVDDDTAAELVEPVVRADALLLSDPVALDTDGLASLAADEALLQVRATALEYEVLGWRQVGTPVVAFARVLEAELEADPPRVRVEVCLDHTDVDVVDDAGNSVVDPSASRRALNLFGLERRDGVWVVVDRDLPVDTDC